MTPVTVKMMPKSSNALMRPLYVAQNRNYYQCLMGRSRVRECLAPTGATVSNIYRDLTPGIQGVPSALRTSDLRA